MSTEGGLIIYGVREYKEMGTFAATPIELAGVRERIGEVVASHVHERVQLSVHELPLADDSTNGFVLVEVPASPRAPHMVQTKGHHRYYGRTPAGNVILDQTQVAHLYARRSTLELEAGNALDEAIAAFPRLPVASGTLRGDLYMVVHPLVSDSDLRERVFPDDAGPTMLQAVLGTQNDLRFETQWDPKFSDISNGARFQTIMDGFSMVNPSIDRDGEQIDLYVSQIDVLDNGTVRYFRAALARQVAIQTTGQPAVVFLIRDTAAAQHAAHVSLFAGRFLEAAGYHGMADVSLALTQIRTSYSWEWLTVNFPPRNGYPMAPVDDYRQSVRLPAERLVEDPCGVAKELLERLLRTIRRPTFPDPWSIAAI